MSRSHWAWVESRASLSVAIGDVEQPAGFEQQVPLRAGLLVEVISLTQRLIGLLVASLLVIALLPVSALARSSGSSPATPQNRPQTTRRSDLGAVLQALGSGYSSRHGSGRVRALQRRLDRAGEVPGAIDGRYGPATERAVRRFQAAHGLVVDGIAGPVTLAALSGSGLYPGAGYRTGSGSGRVRGLQRRLDRAGERPGPIDGRYGPRTEQAVRRFQAAHGLVVDGIAGPLTLARLGIGRLRHRPIGRSRPPGSDQRVNRPARARRSQRHPTVGRAAHAPAPAPRPPVSSTRSTRSPSLAVIGLAALVLLVALALAVIWLTARHRDQRSGSVDPHAGSGDPQAGSVDPRATGGSSGEPADAIATDPGSADRVPGTDWTAPRASQTNGDQAITPHPQPVPVQSTTPDPETIPNQPTSRDPETIPTAEHRPAATRKRSPASQPAATRKRSLTRPRFPIAKRPSVRSTSRLSSKRTVIRAQRSRPTRKPIGSVTAPPRPTSGCCSKSTASGPRPRRASGEPINAATPTARLTSR